MAPERAGKGGRLGNRPAAQAPSHSPEPDGSRPPSTPEVGHTPVGQAKWEKRVRYVRRCAQREIRLDKAKKTATGPFPLEIWFMISGHADQGTIRNLQMTNSTMRAGLARDYAQTFQTLHIYLDYKGVTWFEQLVKDGYKCLALRTLWIHPPRTPLPRSTRFGRPSRDEKRLEQCLRQLGRRRLVVRHGLNHGREYVYPARQVTIELGGWYQEPWPHLPNLDDEDSERIADVDNDTLLENLILKHRVSQNLFWILRRHCTGFRGLSTQGSSNNGETPFDDGNGVHVEDFISAADYDRTFPDGRARIGAVNMNTLNVRSHAHMKVLDLTIANHDGDDLDHFAKFLAECHELETLKLRVADDQIKDPGHTEIRADLFLKSLNNLPAQMHLPRGIRNLLLAVTPSDEGTRQGWRDFVNLVQTLDDAPRHPIRNFWLYVTINNREDFRDLIAMFDVFFGPGTPIRDSVTIAIDWETDMTVPYSTIQEEYFRMTNASNTEGWPATREQLTKLTQPPYALPVPWYS